MAAKDYADNARRLADRASGISVILFVGLLVSVLSDFRPRVASFRDAAVGEAMLRRTQRAAIITRVESSRRRRPRNLDSLLAAAEAELERRRGRISDRARDSIVGRITQLESEKENRDETQRAYQRAVGKIGALNVVRDAQRRAIENVKLKGFGFELGVRGSWASIVWLLVLFLGLLNLCVARFSVAGELQQAVAQDDTILETFRVPLWLFPVSGPPLVKRNAIAFLDTLTLAIVLLVIVSVVAAAWMARLALAAPLFLAPGHFTEGVMASVVVSCLAAAIVATLTLWAIPVSLTDEPGDAARRAARRRLVFALPVLVAITTASTVPPTVRRLLQQTLLRPRRRRRRTNAPVMASGFYAHHKTHKIHFVPSGGRANSLRGARVDDFVKLDAKALKATDRPNVHVKSLVPYARQMVANLGGDYVASASVLRAMLGGPEEFERSAAPVVALSASSVPISAPVGQAGSARGTANKTTRPRKPGLQARSHGKTRRGRSPRGNRDGFRSGPQLVQVADLLARLGARTGEVLYCQIALRHVRPRSIERDAPRTFAERMDEIKDGSATRLTSNRHFTLRRLEAAIQQLSETADRRKYETELRTQLASQTPALADSDRLEARFKRRERIWSSRFWMSDYNQKVRLMRHRGRRKKRDAEQRG